MRRSLLEPFMMKLRDGELVIEVLQSHAGHLIFFTPDGEHLPEASFSTDELVEIDERAEEIRITGEDRASRLLRRVCAPVRTASSSAGAGR